MKTITLTPSQNATAKIQGAIDDCFLSGGGKVELQAGTYVTGAIRLRSNVTLYLKSGAVLQGTRNPADYYVLQNDKVEPMPEEEKTDVIWQRYATSGERNNDFIHKAGSNWNNALIRIFNAENCAVIGEEGSIIDGADCYDETGEERYRGPHGIGARNSKNLLFQGYTIRNTGNWAHELFFCQDLRFENLTILAGHDGIHIAACDNTYIANCDLQTGDDCVAGFDNQNVLVEDCLLNTACSAFRFGGTDVTLRRCKCYGPAKYYFRGSLSLEDKISGNPAPAVGRKNMLSLFTYYSDFTLKVRALPQNILVEDCVAEGVDRFLHFNFSGNEYWQCNRPLAQIAFERVTATGVGMSLCAYGDKQQPVILQLTDCKIAFAEEVSELVRAANYKTIALHNVSVANCNGPAVLSWGGDGNLVCKNVTGAQDRVEQATKTFTCDPI